MDPAAFDSQRTGLRLTLSYELTLSPRKTRPRRANGLSSTHAPPPSHGVLSNPGFPNGQPAWAKWLSATRRPPPEPHAAMAHGNAVHTPLAVLAWWFVHLPHPTCHCAPTGTCGIRLQQHNPNQQCLAPSVAARAAFAGSFQCEKPTEALNASVWHRLVFDDFDGARARAAAAASPNKPPSPWVTR